LPFVREHGQISPAQKRRHLFARLTFLKRLDKYRVSANIVIW